MLNGKDPDEIKQYISEEFKEKIKEMIKTTVNNHDDFVDQKVDELCEIGTRRIELNKQLKKSKTEEERTDIQQQLSNNVEKIGFDANGQPDELTKFVTAQFTDLVDNLRAIASEVVLHNGKELDISRGISSVLFAHRLFDNKYCKAPGQGDAFEEAIYDLTDRHDKEIIAAVLAKNDRSLAIKLCEGCKKPSKYKANNDRFSARYDELVDAIWNELYKEEHKSNRIIPKHNCNQQEKSSLAK